MHPRRLALSVLLASSFALPACGEESPDVDDAETAVGDEAEDGVGAARSAIVGGAADGEHPAVVALTLQGQAFCSGALIAPKVVLTAAHCLHEDFVGALPISELRVFFGADVAGAGTFVEVTEVRLHPDFAGDVPGRQEDDVAIVHLAMEAPVDPMPLGEAPKKGADLTVVGFGRTAADVAQTGVKRTGASRISQVTPRLLVMKPEPGGTCLGDSGGPALARIDGVEVVVGLHTRSDCRSGMIEERVDAHLDGFLRGAFTVAIADRSGDAGPDATAGAADQTDDEDEALEGDLSAPISAGCSTTGTSSSPSSALVGAAIAALSVLRRRQHDARRRCGR